MATNVQKITLSPSRDIPFNKLLLSQSNVRRIKAGVSIEELAEDIARRGLLQGLSVRPVVDDTGVETGMFEIPAGGRRYRALELLVKQKRLARTAPVPCIIREGGIAEEDSLAENVQRAPLHPLDQFRAFLALREKGQSEEEIAAAFFVSVGVVKQRLKLASVSPVLLAVYAEDGMTLDQLMAFTVSGDHALQEQVFERLKTSYDKQPYAIRRMLTEGAVRACDKRAQFIGLEAYVEAGGIILRDLFQGDDGGWLQDVALVDRLVAEKLKAEADAVAAEGWKWVEMAPDFAYGHTYGLRQLRGETLPLSTEEEASRDALQAEYDRLSTEYAEADDLPDDVDARLGEIETVIDAFEARPITFDPLDVARAGAFVSIAHDGAVRIERGYVRPEDELPTEPEATVENAGPHLVAAAAMRTGEAVMADAPAPEPEEDEGLSALSDRLMTELTSHRTLGLRQALGERPEVAFLAALHALTLKSFYRYGSDSCLELDLKSVAFSAQAPGLNDSASAAAIHARHEGWAKVLPKDSADLWEALRDWDSDSRSGLFAHVVSLSVNAVHEAWNRRPRALHHADQLACAVDLDMAAAGWKPTVDNFLGRVTKARSLQAVSEAIRLLLNQIGRRLTEDLQAKDGRHRLLLMLDEFPALGRLDFFESALAFMAGYGLKAFLIAQSLNQIEKAYGPNNSILDNCHVRVSFATNDERTAKRVSDALGTATEMKAMKNYAGHRLSPWLGHLMVSRSETARPLLTPGEVMQLPPTDEIVMVAGTPPIRAKKARYYEDARLRDRLLPPPTPTRGSTVQHDDWTTLPLPRPQEGTGGSLAVEGRDDDPTGSEHRHQPELSRVKPVEKMHPIENEFEFDTDRDDELEDVATRNRRMTGLMQGVARQVRLNPNDGMEL